LSRRIIELGGKPVWDFYLLENKTEFKDIINRHIDYETRAIDFYGRLLERVDDETKILLGGIREEEERHLNKLNEIARIIK
jgi:rubrerythrin